MSSNEFGPYILNDFPTRLYKTDHHCDDCFVVNPRTEQRMGIRAAAALTTVTLDGEIVSGPGSVRLKLCVDYDCEFGWVRFYVPKRNGNPDWHEMRPAATYDIPTTISVSAGPLFEMRTGLVTAKVNWPE